ncbi:hypothetical protein HUA74_11920 [Myxococcus sp. CA051A]|uniref:Lipoprotein n=1 Tax=Myxococcus llanfairpwllgwyngyllgogerychwyrndrobwllllantysiliogogogochensis TaxID=2590453 RepID=A0A540WPJ7_9BACT|nr:MULTISPECIES: hypothetical protein [Myxococcus]NTX05166.1 hypothetical protein [Myxococcus sp. CA040A]NTX09206.1 hypothetical protein [Myxococcus sp. CA056]NTX39728.1 hypothetical protein [Myxococcus sp. CA033]NTX57238.1 hypothetical protein [Myxococcus sp. CA039A]NTX61375.1 hypothetical protein [Myxococcus sp. CA051A]
MRFLWFATAVAWLATGCARITPERLEAQVQETLRWQREYQVERERTEAVAMRLAALEATIERLTQERAEVEQGRLALMEELVRTEADRHALEEHNTQLLARERELNELREMHEQLSDVFYESALERARRRLPSARQPDAPEAGDGTAVP